MNYKEVLQQLREKIERDEILTVRELFSFTIPGSDWDLSSWAEVLGVSKNDIEYFKEHPGAMHALHLRAIASFLEIPPSVVAKLFDTQMDGGEIH